MKPDQPFKRILAVKLADFGDALLVEPALRLLREAHPHVKLDVLTTKNGLSALARLPYLNQVLLFDKYQFDNPRDALKPSNLKPLLEFARQLAFARYDAVIFFHHLTTRWGALKFAALAFATLAPLRVGLDNQTGRAWFLNHTITDGGFGYAGQAERLYWLKLVETLGAANVSELMNNSPADPTRPLFVLHEAEREQAQLWLEELRAGQSTAPVVAIYPGSGNYALVRRWLPLRFAQVADELVERFGAKIVFVGSKSETEVAQGVARLMRHPATILSGQTTLFEAGALLEKCDLLVGNDGGLMHLAAVLNTPTVAIFGPTNSLAWSPYGWSPDGANERVEVVQAPINLACRPCLYRGKTLGKRYGCAPRPCLNQIETKQVVDAAVRVLSNRLKLRAANFVDYPGLSVD